VIEANFDSGGDGGDLLLDVSLHQIPSHSLLRRLSHVSLAAPKVELCVVENQKEAEAELLYSEDHTSYLQAILKLLGSLKWLTLISLRSPEFKKLSGLENMTSL